MRCTRNPPCLFKEQRRRGRNTWPAATSPWGLRAGGGRLLSIHFVRDNQTGSQAEKSNHNPTKHHVSLKTEDRNFEARRFNIHRALGGCSERGRPLGQGWALAGQVPRVGQRPSTHAKLAPSGSEESSAFSGTNPTDEPITSRPAHHLSAIRTRREVRIEDLRERRENQVYTIHQRFVGRPRIIGLTESVTGAVSWA